MKKLLTALASVFCCLCIAIGLVACGDNQTDSGSSQNVSYVITVQAVDESPEAGVTVNLYDGNTVVASGVTGADGKATISAPAGTYGVGLSNLPSGYSQLTKASKTDENATPMTIVVSSGIPEGVTAPSGHTYTVGNVMYDFTVQTAQGKTFTLSNELKEKDMVLINFWATWCGPCKSEFPAMDKAYEAYSDLVSIIALSTSDDMDTVDEFQTENELSFDMSPDSAGLSYMFGATSIPLSVVVDRNGVICWTHTGSMTEAKDFTTLFDGYVGDDYVPNYGSVVGGGSGSDEDVQIEYSKPTAGLAMPASSAIESAINNVDSGFNFGYTAETGADKEYSWPWLVSADGKSIYPSNIDNHYSFATIYTKVQLNAGQAVAFDYQLNTEEKYDLLYVLVDGVITYELHGSTDNTFKSCFAYVAEKAGTYTLSLMYYKDMQTTIDGETVLVKNMRIAESTDVTVGTNVLRYAADYAVENWTAESGVPHYQRYATPVYNAEDGFYHVGSANGPLLMADIRYPTKWSSNSLYELAYYDRCIFDIHGVKVNFKEDITTYAWMCTHSDTGYVPVSQDLKYLLELVTNNLGVGYANEWLELCVYYDHFGPADENVITNPVAGIHFWTAIKVEIPDGETSVTFTNYITKALIPRGYKYAFTPKASGVYQISSLTTPKKLITCDPIGWIFDATGSKLLAENDGYPDKYILQENEDGELEKIFDPNFYFTMYLQKDVTYYVVCADYDIYFNGSYDVKIEYLGETATYLTNCALGPHVFAEDGSEPYLPDAIKYALDEDGYYRAVNADGSLGSYIYLNVFEPTPMYSSTTIYDILLDSVNYKVGAFNFTNQNKPDYTKTMIDYANKAYNAEGEEKGYVKVDTQLQEILQLFMKTQNENTVGKDAWLLLCKYFKTLGAN